MPVRKRGTYKKKPYKKKYVKKNYKKRKANKITTTKIPRSMNIIGDRTMVKLTWYDNGNSKMSNAGASNMNVRYTPNGLYDVDPVLGSTAVPGFAEYAQFYYSYRVHAYAYKVTFTNLEPDVPVLAYVFPTHTDPGANTSYSTASEWISNPYFKSRQLSPKGGQDRGTIMGYVGVKRFVGSKSSDYDDTYSALVTANPTNLLWLAVGAYTQANVGTTAGVAYAFKVTMYVEFFERKTLLA